MARIKIGDLPEDAKISKELMRKIAGGIEYSSPTLEDPNALIDVIYQSKASITEAVYRMVAQSFPTQTKVKSSTMGR